MHWLGRKGVLTEQLKALGTLPAPERAGRRRAHQQRSNSTPARRRIEARRGELERPAVEARTGAGAIDVTLPGRGERLGGLHPITLTRLRIEEIFRRAGFEVAEGPEIENDFHNFEALNIPAESSGARHARHVLSEGRLPAAHAYLAGADPRDAGAEAADRADRTRARVSRRLGCQPLAHVPSGRGPVRR